MSSVSMPPNIKGAATLGEESELNNKVLVSHRLGAGLADLTDVISSCRDISSTCVSAMN
jgi:hypothetical protein